MEKEIISTPLHNKRRGIFIFLCLILILVSPAFSETYGKTLYKNLSKRLSRDREDYSYLSDREFANFREVRTTGIKPGKLFRSSSPVKTWGNRNSIADKEAEKSGVKTFINLADSNQSMREHKNFYETYYSRQNIIGLKLSTKFFTNDFKQGLLRGIKFMIENEPPYLIHCDLGKDRAGFVCSLIECLMGAGYEEIINDYMASFYNYFGIVEGTKEYEYISENEIKNFLAKAFNVKTIENQNLEILAERYFLNLGLSVNEISELKRILSTY